jgi:hypothetical protein
MYKWNKIKYKTPMQQKIKLLYYTGSWLSLRPESGFDKKTSKNAEISLNLTTQITNLFSRLKPFGGVLHRMW